MALAQQIEEVLEWLWSIGEQGQEAVRNVDGAAFDFDAQPAILEAQRRGWVAGDAEHLALTRAGEERAAGVMRRHRLAERLLFDVIRVDNAAMEAGACELEHAHILSEEATDRVCAFLGHPPTCPHDRPIPRGRCCEKFSSEVRPLVTPLSDGSIGADYRIVFIASRSHRRLDRLCGLGVVPGAELHLHQRLPAFIVRVGGTDIALEPEIAADIFVVPR
ncbi:MAG TPA: metal-dependent transcriptional regulator [Candidatus Margulisiibacteriota bacterium]|nr:metal-dependent transcriptional regulator [Candidatus Margulisiibacteriota bacterium]